ncbi:MAG: HAMP domain-containing sensor histidine kinase [Eubacteriales bacterium]
MLKRLRLRFTLIILTLFLAVLGSTVVVLSIYIYRSTVTQTEMILAQTADGGGAAPQHMSSGEEDNALGAVHTRDESKFRDKPLYQLETVTFRYDSDGNITETIYSFPDEDSEAGEALLALAESLIAGGESGGKCSLGGSGYRFLLRGGSAGGVLVIGSRDNEIGTAGRLLLIDSIVLLGGAALLTLISALLSRWAVKPVGQAWERQKRFIADASHELKTPLTVISTNLELVMQNPSETVRSQSKWLGYIASESAQMKTLVGDLLYLARLDASEDGILPSSEIREFSLSDAVTDACLPFESVAFEAGASLECDIEPDIAMIGNENELHRLTAIFLDNAIKNTPRGGNIKISLTKRRNELRLECENTGETIAPEHLARIFERFYRADSSRDRNTGGYGLGLSIAHSIIASHKGRAEAASENGVTRFTAVFTI